MVGESGKSSSAPLLEQVLTKRGLTPQELGENISDLPDEALLANIDLAADRISRALYKNEPLVIFGHDDPDGVTSTYILYQFLNSCGYQRHNYFIPNRNIEPHGIGAGFVDFVRRGAYRLAITVDNGIASAEGVNQLKELGCETIILDHHLIQPEQLPRALAIVNPQLEECPYPAKNLAGVGVVLMLLRHLSRVLEHQLPLSAYFWAAIGSISDKVPMLGANRVIVRHVLQNWRDLKDPSVEFLLRNYARVEDDMDVFNFLQHVARLIANGREANGQHLAMRFLLERGDAKAKLFQQMEAQRKAWEAELGKIFGYLDTITAGFSGTAFIYFDDEGIIPYSLLGTASTYILGKLGIPTIMLKQHNGDVVCEGRCGEGFNMVEAFRHCREYLKQYGGHVKAAGFTLEPDNYDGFLECFNHYLAQTQLTQALPADSEPDARLQLSDLNSENWQGLVYLLPFGQQNPEPEILVENCRLEEMRDSFALDFNAGKLPFGLIGNARVNWKAPNQLRVLAFQETESAGEGLDRA